MFISTNVGLSTQEILDLYVKRWPIEVFFRNSKSKLALDTYQIRSQKGIERYWLIMSFTHYLCCICKGGYCSFEEGYQYLAQSVAIEHLEQLYKRDIAKPPKERNYLSLNAFLLQHKEAIYTRKQMIDLVSRFEEVGNPTKKADKFKDKHRIEYFSQKDLDYIIGILKKKTSEYFNS